ncbi:MAG TPA: methyltransferase domain-containing protein [Xanthomonadales bacterium]|nr:methyltransferase domain-containing protein [Xanthomonadales bacterium]
MNTAPLKLDLACGVAKKPGFFGVDISADSHADLVCDLRTGPWPWADASVAEINSAHFFEHLTAEQRVLFMDECWRILVPGGKLVVTVPHARSDGAVQDPTHEWPPLVEQSFFYFDREARTKLNIQHYGIKADFQVQIGIAFLPEWAQRPQAERMFALRHFHNVASEITAFLTKRG